MKLEIPGRDALEMDTLILDFNGTIAVDGKIPTNVAMRIKDLSKEFTIYVLTADTYGHAKRQCHPLPVTIKTFPEGEAGEEKSSLVSQLGPHRCVALGNGYNDIKMFQQAALSIAVIGQEGCSGKLLSHADIVAASMEDALSLLLQPLRVIACLRW